MCKLNRASKPNLPKVHLHRGAGKLIDPALHTKVEELIPNLHLQSTEDGGVDLGTQNDLLALADLVLHGGRDGVGLGLGQRVGADDGSADLAAAGLHELAVRVDDLGCLGEAGVAGQRRHEVEGDVGHLSGEHVGDGLLLVVAGDEGIFQELRKGRAGGGRVGDGEELALDLVELAGFGRRGVDGVGVAGVQAVELEGRPVGGVVQGGSGSGVRSAGGRSGGGAGQQGGGGGEHVGVWGLAVGVVFWSRYHGEFAPKTQDVSVLERYRRISAR